MDEQALLDQAFVRIYGDDGAIVGAGFLVAPGYIVTCAHVVNDALRRDRTERKKPEVCQEISVDFPLAPRSPIVSCPSVQTRVLGWAPIDCHTAFQDIAVLEPISKIPAQVQSIPVKLHCERSRVMLKGFPVGFDDAAIVPELSIKGRTGRSLIQLNNEGKTGIPPQPGFSGAPVWDREQQAAVGMLVLTAADQDFAQMISASVLQYVFWILMLHCGLDVTQTATKKIIEPAYRYAMPENWIRSEGDWSFDRLLLELGDTVDSEIALSKFSAYLLALSEFSDDVLREQFQNWCNQHLENFHGIYQQAVKDVAQQSEQRRSQEQGEIEAHLLVLIQPVADRYQVSAWRIPDFNAYDVRKWEGFDLWRQTEEAIQRNQIADVFCRWMQESSVDLSHTLIEFCVPLDLLDEPIDRWEVEDEFGISLPLEAEYRVVLRSLERTMCYAKRDDWLQYWQNKDLQANDQASEVLVEGCLDVKALFASLNICQPKAAMPLGFRLSDCPDRVGKGSVFALLLRTGHPIAVWLRESIPEVDCRQELEAILRTPVKTLPLAIQQARSAALKGGGNCSIGRHIGILWENPHLLPPIVDESANLSNRSLG
ncbi:MAG: hypothetical protein B0A82_24515 [Alkalinema sp. CACIAM 70d]|nr:MAG: hypothetical protein B0A82_24515 [Alkalinema sp. CACIAM 70d]